MFCGCILMVKHIQYIRLERSGFMQDRKITFNVLNVVSYVLGFFILGFAVVALMRSGLGAGAWDTTTFATRAFINLRFPNYTLGMASMTINIAVMTIVLLYRRDWKLLFILIPILVVGSAIDFWDIVVFGDYYAEGFWSYVLFFVGGLMLPLGLSLVMLSNFPAFVFDEWMLMMMDVFKTEKMARVRLGIEVFGITLALVFGYIAGIGFGQINIGTLVLAFALGPIMQFYVKKLRPIYLKNNEKSNEL